MKFRRTHLITIFEKMANKVRKVILKIENLLILKFSLLLKFIDDLASVDIGRYVRRVQKTSSLLVK